jgi:acyl-CoA synthetase (AMP-forming)/AMP-acid ligase II
LEPYEGVYLRENADKKRPRGVTLCPLPFFHIYGLVVGMCVPMVAGAMTVFMPAFDLKTYLRLVQFHKVGQLLSTTDHA